MILDTKDLQEAIMQTDRMLEDSNPVSATIGAVIVAAANVAREDGITHFFGGLGSEEVFAGYKRHRTAADLEHECWRGFEKMYDRDLVRDCMIAGQLGIIVHTPFLDEKCIILALRLS